MATAPQSLTIEEFRSRYSQQKPYFEYWFGQAIQKNVPTWLHSVLQGIVREALVQAGYKSGLEVELRIDPNWQPVPDVIGSLKSIRSSYPTEPVEVVVEILSPDDRMNYVMSKCRNYERLAIPQIFVLDPEERTGWQWKQNGLEAISDIRLGNGSVIGLDELWRQLDAQA